MPSNRTRRACLLTLASAGTAVLAGCADGSTATPQANETATATGTTSSPATPTPAPDFDGYLDDVDNYDGTVTDLRGRDTITVEVGVAANGGNFGFGPPAVHIDTGTTVLFKWTGDGGAHSVVSEDDGPLDSGGVFAELGVHYEYTFESDGLYPYHCEPHEGLGMHGAIVVGDDYPTA